MYRKDLNYDMGQYFGTIYLVACIFQEPIPARDRQKVILLQDEPNQQDCNKLVSLAHA